MGAFNSLFTQARCPVCGAVVEFEVQFRFGDTWQFEYRIGDRVEWGGNDVGTPGLAKVVVEGFGVCPSCRSGIEFDIVVVDDELTDVVALGTTRP